MTYNIHYVKYIIELLNESHNISRFQSGNDDLDLWLSRYGCQTQSNNTTRTYVSHNGDKTVFGYFCLSAHVVQKSELDRSLSRGSPEKIPAILLAKFALGKEFHNRGVGADFLRQALRLCLDAGEIIGARFVIVDAIDEKAAGFYRHYGFKSALESPLHLARKMSDIKRQFDSADV